LIPSIILVTDKSYRFYGGNLVFRGHFTATGEETGFNLTVQGGLAFAYSVFLNGMFLGSNEGSSTVSMTSATWNIPQNTLRIGKDNVLTLVQGSSLTGHNLFVADHIADHMGYEYRSCRHFITELCCLAL
jgi:hypothetical protein